MWPNNALKALMSFTTAQFEDTRTFLDSTSKMMNSVLETISEAGKSQDLPAYQAVCGIVVSFKGNSGL